MSHQDTNCSGCQAHDIISYAVKFESSSSINIKQCYIFMPIPVIIIAHVCVNISISLMINMYKIFKHNITNVMGYFLYVSGN